MTKEELKQQRYKVIADYPNSRLQIGDILVKYMFKSSTLGTYTYTTNLESPLQGICCKPEWVEVYPYLFYKMRWWEDRKTQEMPEYVKQCNGNDVYKVHKHFDHQDEIGWCFVAEYDMVSRYYKRYLPATEAEYLTFIK